MDLEPYQWRQTDAGVYERSMDGIERLYWTVASAGKPLGREHWSLTTGVKLQPETENLVSVVRQGWIALRHAHPSLASHVENGKKVYKVATEDELKSWLVETFVVVDSTATDLFPTLKPVRRTTLYLMPKCQEIVIKTPHDRTDARGLLYLCNNLLQLIANPQTVHFGDEAQRLSPPLVVAVPLPKATPEQAAKAGQLLVNFGQALPSVGVPAVNTDQLPANTHRQELCFSKDTTFQIIAAAKRHNMTATHVVHAAVVVATSQLAKSNGSFSSYALFDLRKHCQPAFRYMPMSAYHSGLPYTVPAGSFLETAEQLRHFYRQAKQGQEVTDDFLAGIEPLIETMLQVLAQPPLTPPSQPMFSSFGTLENILQGDQCLLTKPLVLDWWFGQETLSPEPLVHFWTWQDEMKISTCYNETFHDANSIEMFLQTIKEVLLSGLEIRSMRSTKS